MGRGGCDETQTLPCKEGRRERRGKAEGRRREREAGSGSSARAPSAPVPGLQGAQRAPPGPRPPDALPDTTLPGAWTTAYHGHCTGTAPHRAGHYNGHYFPAPDIAPCSLPPALDAFPSLCRGPDIEPPAGSGDRPLAPQHWTRLPPGPLLSSSRASSLPGSGPSTSSLSDPPLLGRRCPRPHSPTARPDASPRGIVVAPLLPSRLHSSAPGLRGRRA